MMPKKFLSSATKKKNRRAYLNSIHLILQVNNATARVQTKKSGGKSNTNTTSMEQNSIPKPPLAFGTGNVLSELSLFFFWDAIRCAGNQIFGKNAAAS